jgi:hypothetical protein
MQGNNLPAIGRELGTVYNLLNSQWYIQWLRTLRNRGAERLPKDRKAGQRRSSLAGFFYLATVEAEAFDGLVFVRNRDQKLYRNADKAINQDSR